MTETAKPADMFSRESTEKMRDALRVELQRFQQDKLQIEAALKQHNDNINRTEGALVVVEKLLAGEGPLAEKPPVKEARKRK